MHPWGKPAWKKRRKCRFPWYPQLDRHQDLLWIPESEDALSTGSTYRFNPHWIEKSTPSAIGWICGSEPWIPRTGVPTAPVSEKSIGRASCHGSWRRRPFKTAGEEKVRSRGMQMTEESPQHGQRRVRASRHVICRPSPHSTQAHSESEAESEPFTVWQPLGVIHNKRETDRKEGWAPKSWCFPTVVLEKTLESPLDSKEIQPAYPKGNQSWILVGRTDAETPILWPPDVNRRLIGEAPDAGKDWRQKKRVAGNEMIGWHHRLNAHALRDSDGQGSLVCCSPWSCNESYKTYRLNSNNIIITSKACIP